MSKHTIIIGLIISLTSCEFIKNASVIQEELTSNKLGTETMSPRNEFGKFKPK